MNYRKETQPHGDELFPLSIHVFETDLQSTVRVYCHWHEEVELFYAVKGEAVFHMARNLSPAGRGDRLCQCKPPA